MKFKLCLGAFVVAANFLVSHGEPKIIERKNLNDKEKENIVDVLVLTPDGQKKMDTKYLVTMMEIVSMGIESVAKDLPTIKDDESSMGSSSITPMATETPIERTPESQPTDAETTASSISASTLPEEGGPKRGEHRSKRGAEGRVEEKTPTTTQSIIPVKWTTIFVVDGISEVGKFDFSKPLEFLVRSDNEIVDGQKLAGKAGDIVAEIEKMAKDKVDFTIAVVNKAMPSWAIVLIVIAVLLVVGAAGYFIISYFRKQR